jgi:hypothetical protein
MLNGFDSRPRRTSKRSKRDLALDAASQDEFVYDDLSDSNCVHEDIGEPVAMDRILFRAEN